MIIPPVSCKHGGRGRCHYWIQAFLCDIPQYELHDQFQWIIKWCRCLSDQYSCLLLWCMQSCTLMWKCMAGCAWASWGPSTVAWPITAVARRRVNLHGHRLFQRCECLSYQGSVQESSVRVTYIHPRYQDHPTNALCTGAICCTQPAVLELNVGFQLVWSIYLVRRPTGRSNEARGSAVPLHQKSDEKTHLC